MTRFVLSLALAAALTATGCAKHGDTSSSATDAPSAAADSVATAAATDVAASPDASSSPVAVASAEASGMTMSGDGGSVTVNSDASKLGVPVYPNAKIGDNQLVDATSNGTHTVTALLTTSDDFATVDAWYKAHLPSTFKPFHMQMGDAEMTTYTQGTEQALPYDTISVTRKKGDLETKPSTAFVVATKEAVK